MAAFVCKLKRDTVMIATMDCNTLGDAYLTLCLVFKLLKNFLSPTYQVACSPTVE